MISLDVVFDPRDPSCHEALAKAAYIRHMTEIRALRDEHEAGIPDEEDNRFPPFNPPRSLVTTWEALDSKAKAPYRVTVQECMFALTTTNPEVGR